MVWMPRPALLRRPSDRTAWQPGAVVFGVGECVWDSLRLEAVAATLVLAVLACPRFVLDRLAGTWTGRLPPWT